MARPTIEEKKKTLSVSINIELDEILDKICEEKNINKSKYIEHLIKKEMEKENDKSQSLPLILTFSGEIPPFHL